MSDRPKTNDIAVVLRAYLDGNPEARGQVEFVDASDLLDAAAEIERLRGAVDSLENRILELSYAGDQ
jgi:hypothetical protein